MGYSSEPNHSNYISSSHVNPPKRNTELSQWTDYINHYSETGVVMKMSLIIFSIIRNFRKLFLFSRKYLIFSQNSSFFQLASRICFFLTQFSRNGFSRYFRFNPLWDPGWRQVQRRHHAKSLSAPPSLNTQLCKTEIHTWNGRGFCILCDGRDDNKKIKIKYLMFRSVRYYVIVHDRLLYFLIQDILHILL